MEPLAPGTEDEPLYNQVSNKPTKKETAEEQALSKKAFLPNGTFGPIFELNYVQGAQHWYCRVCECPVLGKLFNHEIGKRHTANLEHWNKRSDVPKDLATPVENSNMETAAIVVAPGEPVPPGFEGEIEKTTMIQERLDGFNAGPLVGLEYLLELLDYDPSKEPSYLCILCDKKGDPRTVLTHLSSYNHQVMYLQKHFPTVYRHIAPFMIKQYKRNWQSGLQKIADSIENTFGRLKPMQVEAGKFEKDRMHYIEIVAKGKHFSELMGHTFEDVVPKEELIRTYEETKPYDRNLPFHRQPAPVVPKRKSPSPPVVPRPTKKKATVEQKPRKRSLSPVSDISSSDLEDYEPTKKPTIKQQWTPKESYSNKRERSPFSRRRSPSPPKRKEGPMPWQKSNYGRGKLTQVDRNRDDKTEKLEEYKKLTRAIDNDMEQVLKKHKLNPEKHPKYNDEWKKFWNLRYKELQSEGKNASTHDFKPEWIEFWNKRIQELHQDEIKTKKVALRRRLGLPDEPAPISFKIGERRKLSDQSKGPLPTAAQPDNDPEVIVIEDNDKDSIRSRSPPPTTRRNKSRSPYAKRARDLSPQYRRRSPPSLTRRARNASPISPPLRGTARKRSSERSGGVAASSDFERISPTPLRTSPPPSRRDRYSSPDRYVRVRDRSSSRGRSREISWEKERHRDYDDASWERSYRGSRGWDGPGSSHRYVKMVDPYAPPKILRDVTREPVLDPISDEDDEVNIVAVLRLLTALEEKLGSLGPKIIELLGQALALEKKAANSSEQLLDSEINCVLFETVKEKLKGQLLAGFVDGIKEKAFKRAIKKTASLIHAAGERKKKREVELPKKPVVVPGVGSVDKGKIARQIANALIAQGKTDVTQAELEQLINAVVGIAEAQKNSSQPLTTAAFLEKLSSGSAGGNDEKKPEINPPKPNHPKRVTDKDEASNVETKPTLDNKLIDEPDTNSQDKSIINMEGLSDSDLQTLLQNFKDLSTDEQHGLINYLKKLEAKEPERVEKLRKFVDMTDVVTTAALDVEKKDAERYSPFSKRTVSINPTSKNDAKNDTDNVAATTTSFVQIDSEEEDYSFDDVAKAASKNVIETEMERKRMAEDAKKEADDKNLNDAKALISSLMSSLNKTNSSVSATTESKQENPSGKVNIISNIPVSSTEIVNSLGGITMSVSSLGSILGNVQNMRQQKEELKFSPPPTNQQQQQPNRPAPNENLRSRNNPYNEFDITSQRDIRKNTADFNHAHQQANNDIMGRAYDDFNIEPNADEYRDEMPPDSSRGGGMNYPQRGEMTSQFIRPSIGYPDRPGPLSQDTRQPERKLNFRPPPFMFQALTMRPPGGANFDSRDSRSDFMRADQRMNEPPAARGGDYHRGFNDMRGGDYNRLGQGNFRGGNNDTHRGGVPRGALPPMDPNRLGNGAPQQRYGGNNFGGGNNGGFNSNNNNSFKRW